MSSFKDVDNFENIVANFFGSTYGIATDSCTHAIELCLRYDSVVKAKCPKHTYVSIPMTFSKIGIEWSFENTKWYSYYTISHTRIIDAAVLWKENSYVPGSLMCLSFQYRKHLRLGRGGMILTDDKTAAEQLTKMAYDGRDRHLPWSNQNIDTLGYHYYMTPEIASHGIKEFKEVKDTPPSIWSYKDYPDLSKMSVFNELY